MSNDFVRDDILPEELITDQSFQVERAGDQISQNLLPIVYDNLVSQGEPQRSRQPSPALDIDGLYRLVGQAIDDMQVYEGVSVENKILYLEDFPPDYTTTEVITFGLQRRSPATQGGPAFQGKHQELKPRIRDIANDPEHPGNKLYTIGQQFENIVTFTCWAKTNKQVNIRALWFEDMMRQYAWYFRYHGITECIFWGRGEDMKADADGKGNLVHGRPMYYYVRTERLTHLSEPTIRRILLRYGVRPT